MNSTTNQNGNSKMSGKSDKSQSPHKKKTEKKSGEGRKYAQISCDSITLVAEANGISVLNEEISNQLAEDISYRLREVIHNCSVHLRQNKRRRLTASDVNTVFRVSNIPMIYGHMSKDPIGLLYLKEANIFVPEEVEVNLAAIAMNNEAYIQKADPFLKERWLSPDNALDSSANLQIVKSEDVKPVSLNLNNSSISSTVPSHLLSYYKHISKIILGDSESLLKVVLKDLASNLKIASITPCLLNLVMLGLKKLPKGGNKFYRHRFLQSFEALLSNPMFQFSANASVQTLLSCVLDATIMEGISLRTEFGLRDMTSQVLGKVINCCSRTDTTLYLDILQKLGSVLLDNNSPLRSHFGALRTLCALDYESLNFGLWLHLEKYLVFLEILKFQQEIKLEDINDKEAKKDKIIAWSEKWRDIIEIEGMILFAAEMFYRKKLSKEVEDLQRTVQLERLLDGYFGDRLCARKPYCAIEISERESEEANVLNIKMDVDLLVSSMKTEKSNDDFKMDYQNQNLATNIPTNISTDFNIDKHLSAFLPDRILDGESLISSFFEIPFEQKQHSKRIIFKFAGAKPVSKKLKCRTLDPRHKRLECQRTYINQTHLIKCLSKLFNKHKMVKTRLKSPNIMTFL